MTEKCEVHIPRCDDFEHYLISLQHQEIPSLLRGTIVLDCQIQYIFLHLIDNNMIPLYRKKDVKKIINFFCTNYIQAIAIPKFPLFLPEGAYMTDSGTISISRFLLYNSGGERILKILIHEIAHWWLNNSYSYSTLLLLNQQYRMAEQSIKLPALCAPIELLATKLECEMVLSMSQNTDEQLKETLLRIERTERISINSAIKMLCL